MSDFSEASGCVPLAELYGKQLTVIEGSLDGMFTNASVSADGLPCNGQICGTCTLHQMPAGGELLDLLGVMKQFPNRDIDDQTVRNMVTEPARAEEYARVLSALDLSPNDLRLLTKDTSFLKAVADRIRYLRSRKNSEQIRDAETFDMSPVFVLADIMSSQYYPQNLPRGNSLLLLTAVITDRGYVERKIDKVFARDEDLSRALKDFYFGDHGPKTTKGDRTKFVRERHPSITNNDIVNNGLKLLAKGLVSDGPKELAELSAIVKSGEVSINLQAFAAVVDRMPAHFFDRLFDEISSWYIGGFVSAELKFKRSMLEKLYCIRDSGDLQRGNDDQRRALSRFYNVLDFILNAHEEAQKTQTP